MRMKEQGSYAIKYLSNFEEGRVIRETESKVLDCCVPSETQQMQDDKLHLNRETYELAK